MTIYIRKALNKPVFSTVADFELKRAKKEQCVVYLLYNCVIIILSNMRFQ